MVVLPSHHHIDATTVIAWKMVFLIETHENACQNKAQVVWASFSPLNFVIKSPDSKFFNNSAQFSSSMLDFY